MHNGIALERARNFYDAMQMYYGHKFLSQFNGQTNLNYVFETMAGGLAFMSDEQFQIGMMKLATRIDSNEFCPTLKEFISWCVGGSWWSADKAWVAACRFTTLKKIKTVKVGEVDVCKDITHEAKLALDQVTHHITACRMKEAERLFKSVYSDLISKAQLQGRQQGWYVPPAMLPAPKIAPVAELPISDEGRRIGDLTAQLMAQGMKWGEAFKKAQVEVRGFEKEMFGGVV